MNITILQQSSIKPQDKPLLTLCAKLPKKSLVVMGEYVLNPFFENLRGVPKDKIIKDSKEQIAFLEKLAKKHSISFIAPVIMGDSKGLLKQIVFINGIKNKQDAQKIAPKNMPIFYTQQRLIDYHHWNEQKFFSNPKVRAFREPLIFDYDGMCVGVMFGFEVHFDEIWLKMQKAGVDVVLLPCVNTFESKERWRELCKMRAFLNGCMLVRVNRVGDSVVNGVKWEFYGDSLVAMPNGEVVDSLGNKQEILSLEITRERIVEIAMEWGFRRNYRC